MRKLTIMLIASITMFVSGCDKKEDDRQFDFFMTAISSDYHPKVGDVFVVKEEERLCPLAHTCSKNVYYIRDGFLAVATVLISDESYCDGECLKKGYYKYIGNGMFKVEEKEVVNKEGDKACVIWIEKICRKFVRCDKSVFDEFARIKAERK